MNTISCGPYHDIVISHTQITGSLHRQSRQPCEDAVLIRTARDCLFCGLADGQSGTRYGVEGGRACLEAVADYIDSAGIDGLLHAPFPDELPCSVVKAFRKKLLALAEDKSADLKEFASTLLAIAVDLKTGNYVLLHLGDGCAIGIPRTGEPAFISAPDNGLTFCHTWLTTSDNVVPHLHVCFGSFENKKRILLMSDGAVCFCRGRNIPRRATESLKNSTQSQLHALLLQSDPPDDASCISIDLQETTRSGEQADCHPFDASGSSGQYPL